MLIQYDKAKINVISAHPVLCLRQIPSEDNSGEPYKMVPDIAFTYTAEEEE